MLEDVIDLLVPCTREIRTSALDAGGLTVIAWK